MLRVFLVDDEPPARARMRQLLADMSDVIVVGEAGDAVDAQAGIAAARPDVVFLDIEMPQISGTRLAELLPDPKPHLVFATAFDRYAVDAFAVDATDFLVKPITRARLAGALARVRDRLSRRSDLERDLVAASAAQAALLPRTMPVMAGFESAGLMRAARGVGGDFFVAQAVAADRFVLALGDVSGKGLPASLVASSLQARIETVARHAAGTAADIVADVNVMLCGSTDTGRFATLAYLEVHPGSGQVTLVNAGHLPAVLVLPQQPPQYFPASGPALGLLAEASFEVHQVTIPRGAMLVIYSDGLTEAFDASGEEFGDARLLPLLTRHATSTPAVLCETLIDAARQHAAGVPGDDITVLALKRTAAPDAHSD
jgi:sigma-B regulation protein RsbU (phosphoserine phosphatase)